MKLHVEGKPFISTTKRFFSLISYDTSNIKIAKQHPYTECGVFFTNKVQECFFLGHFIEAILGAKKQKYHFYTRGSVVINTDALSDLRDDDLPDTERKIEK